MTADSPQRWKHFVSRFSGLLYAKPVNRPARVPQSAQAVLASSSSHQTKGFSQTPAWAPNQTQVDQGSLVAERPSAQASGQDSLDNPTPEPQDPVSTVSGRSAFFATPDPRQSLEVRIPEMSVQHREEYDRVSDTSGTHSHTQRPGTPGSTNAKNKKRTQRPGKTIQESVAALNLRQFLYSGRGSSTVGVSTTQKTTGRDNRPRKMASSGGILKSAGKGKKSRTRVSRDEKLRARSTFARAVEQHHQRRRAGNA
jgi:hypothetical protein